MIVFDQMYRPLQLQEMPEFHAFAKASGVPATELEGRVSAAAQIHGGDFEKFSEQVLWGLPEHDFVKQSFWNFASAMLRSPMRGVKAMGTAMKQTATPYTSKGLAGFRDWGSRIRGNFFDDMSRASTRGTYYKGLANDSFGAIAKRNPSAFPKGMPVDAMHDDVSRGRYLADSTSPQTAKDLNPVTHRFTLPSNNPIAPGVSRPPAEVRYLDTPRFSQTPQQVSPQSYYSTIQATAPSPSLAARPTAEAPSRPAPERSGREDVAGTPRSYPEGTAEQGRPQMAAPEVPAPAAPPSAQVPFSGLKGAKPGEKLDEGAMKQLNDQLDGAIQSGAAQALPEGKGHQILLSGGSTATRYNNGNWIRSDSTGQRVRITKDGVVGQIGAADPSAMPAPAPPAATAAPTAARTEMAATPDPSIPQTAGAPGVQVSTAPTARPAAPLLARVQAAPPQPRASRAMLMPEAAPAPAPSATPEPRARPEMATEAPAPSQPQAPAPSATPEPRARPEMATEAPAPSQPQAPMAPSAPMPLTPRVGQPHQGPDGVVYPPARNIEEVKIRESIDAQLANEMRKLDVQGVVDPHSRAIHLQRTRRSLEENLGVNYSREDMAWVPGGAVMGSLAMGGVGALGGAYGANEMGVDPVTGAVIGGFMSAVPGAVGGGLLGKVRANRAAGASWNANPYGRAARAGRQLDDINPLTGGGYSPGLPPAPGAVAAAPGVAAAAPGAGMNLADIRSKAEGFIRDNPLLAVGGAGAGAYLMSNNGQQQGQPIVVTQGM